MEVSDKHPKRVFVKRVIELEVRLSYYDRIKGTIPETMLETAVMADDAPGPEYDYDSSGMSLTFHHRSRDSRTESCARSIRSHARRSSIFFPSIDSLESFGARCRGGAEFVPEIVGD